MSKKEIQKLIDTKQNEYDRIKKKWDYLNEADNPYSSGIERAKKATQLGHLHKTMKELESEIEKLEEKYDASE